jgi:hypothetical protein
MKTLILKDLKSEWARLLSNLTEQNLLPIHGQFRNVYNQVWWRVGWRVASQIYETIKRQ